MARVRWRGIIFEEFPGRQFIDGIAIDGPYKTVWCRDSEGNVLNVRSKSLCEVRALRDICKFALLSPNKSGTPTSAGLLARIGAHNWR